LAIVERKNLPAFDDSFLFQLPNLASRAEARYLMRLVLGLSTSNAAAMAGNAAIKLNTSGAYVEDKGVLDTDAFINFPPIVSLTATEFVVCLFWINDAATVDTGLLGIADVNLALS
jgi:hypothetical protein